MAYAGIEIREAEYIPAEGFSETGVAFYGLAGSVTCLGLSATRERGPKGLDKFEPNKSSLSYLLPIQRMNQQSSADGGPASISDMAGQVYHRLPIALIAYGSQSALEEMLTSEENCESGGHFIHSNTTAILHEN